MTPVVRLEYVAGGLRRGLGNLQPILFSCERRVNAIPQATVVLSVTGDAAQTLHRQGEVVELRPGCEVFVHLDEPLARTSEPVFAGLVVEQSLELRWDRALLTLRLKHGLSRLESGCRSAVYADQTAGDIVSRLLRARNIACTNRGSLGTRIEQSIQVQCSDWRHVRTLLDAHHAWLLPGVQGVELIAPRLAGRPDHALQRRGDTIDVLEARWSFNGQYQPAGLKVASWDVEQQDLAAASAAAPRLGDGAMDPSRIAALDAEPWVVHRGAAVPSPMLEDQAKSMLTRLQQGAVQGEFRVAGSSAYSLGQTLALVGFGAGFDGSGIITAVKHHIDKARWVTTLSLGQQGLLGDSPGSAGFTGLTSGVVAEYEADPRHLQRIRVRLPVLGNQPIWARLALPSASKDAGFHFYPDAGDEVVVGFFHGDFAYPVVLGSTYNPKNLPPVPLSKENEAKGFTLRQDDKHLALMFDANSMTASLQAGEDRISLQGGVRVESPDEIHLAVGDDTLTMSQGIRIASESEIALTADQDQIALKGGIAIQGASGAGEVNVKGKKIKLTST